MSTFKLVFDCDRPAFKTLNEEVAAILKRVASRIENGEVLNSTEHRILDSHGNNVGAFRLDGITLTLAPKSTRRIRREKVGK